MLYCLTCKTVAEEGSAVCANCRNGFVSRLACAKCNRVTPQGVAYCPMCFSKIDPSEPGRMVRAADSYPENQVPIPSVALALPKLPPGISLERVRVPETRVDVGRFGAVADVQMNGRDAEILTKMNQVVVLLHALAQEMNGFFDLMDSTRRCIKSCRNLATDLQEEVETRMGPSSSR
jgi:RNA polymerase subunit RPABC4/transcription elongation factor Spt4